MFGVFLRDLKLGFCFYELLVVVFKEFNKRVICNRCLILNVLVVDGGINFIFICVMGLKGKYFVK